MHEITPKLKSWASVLEDQAKVQAIKGVLASGLIHGLITDENTARALVG